MAKVQQRFVKLEKLLQVEPYKIVGLWSNGEIRLNDFSDEVEKWRDGSIREIKKLSNRKIFNTAFIQDGTLAFSGSTVRVPGITGLQYVDFDRRVLYSDSELIGHIVTREQVLQPNQKRRFYQKRQSKAAQDQLASVEVKSQRSPKIDIDTINQITKKIGTNVRPLFIIGDALIELD